MTKNITRIAALFALVLGSLWAYAYGVSESKTAHSNADAWQEGMVAKQDLLLAHYATLGAWQTLLGEEQTIHPVHVAELVGGVTAVSQASPEACMLHEHAAACFVWVEGRLMLMAEAYRDGRTISLVCDISRGSRHFHL